MPDEIAIADLAILLEQGEVLVIDVRGDDRFARGHIPGSWAVGLGVLPARLRDPDDRLHQQIAAPAARLAVVAEDDHELGAARALLAEVGLRAQSVTGGVAAWSRAGRPLNRGARD